MLGLFNLCVSVADSCGCWLLGDVHQTTSASYLPMGQLGFYVKWEHSPDFTSFKVI